MAPRTPLVDPDAYFARSDGYSLVPALLVVICFWLAIVAYIAVETWYLVGTFEELTSASLIDVARLMGVSLVLLWALYTTILHGVTTVAGGTGGITETIVTAAWGFAPLVVPIGVLLVTMPFAHIAADGLLLLALTFALIWAVYVWTHGLARAHDVSDRRASVGPIITAVFVPVVFLLF